MTSEFFPATQGLLPRGREDKREGDADARTRSPGNTWQHLVKVYTTPLKSARGEVHGGCQTGRRGTRRKRLIAIHFLLSR